MQNVLAKDQNTRSVLKGLLLQENEDLEGDIDRVPSSIEKNIVTMENLSKRAEGLFTIPQMSNFELSLP